MGTRGPIPNRDMDLARPRHRNGRDQGDATRGQSRPVEIPVADENWHPIARMLWESLAKSGQADFYQQSDWAFAYSLMDDLTYYKNGYKRSGQMLQTIYSAMSNLLVTEGDRRRVRIELEAPPSDSTPARV